MSLQEVRFQKARNAGWSQLPTAGGGWQWVHNTTKLVVNSALDPTVVIPDPMAVHRASSSTTTGGIPTTMAGMGGMPTTVAGMGMPTPQAVVDDAKSKIEEKKKELERKKEEERIARLPPGLRARLAARGIIKVDNSAATEDAAEEDAKDNKKDAKKEDGAKQGGGKSSKLLPNLPNLPKLPSMPSGVPSGAAQKNEESSDSEDDEKQTTKEILASMANTGGNENLADDDIPLPDGWQKAKHKDKVYYWNPLNGETTYEHPGRTAIKKAEQEKIAGRRREQKGNDYVEDPRFKVFTFEQKTAITENDVGRIIGKNGGNLKMLQAALGGNQIARIHVPKPGKQKADGKALNGKPTWDLKIQTNDQVLAKKGKRVIDLFLTSGKLFPECITSAGLEAVSIQKIMKEEAAAKEAAANGAANGGPASTEVGIFVKPSGNTIYDQIAADAWGTAGKKRKKEIDILDPSSFCDAPQGGWGVGMGKKTEHGDDVEFQQYR